MNSLVNKHGGNDGNDMRKRDAIVGMILLDNNAASRILNLLYNRALFICTTINRKTSYLKQYSTLRSPLDRGLREVHYILVSVPHLNLLTFQENWASAVAVS